MNLNERFKILVFASSILACFWLLGFIHLINYNPPSQCLGNQKIEVIVVLTGGKHRIEAAMQLFKNTTAKKILISGIGKGVNKSSFMQLMKTYQLKPQDVILGSIAQDTYGNAKETEIFMQLNNYHSLCLVTSSTHMLRSYKIFTINLPYFNINTHAINTKDRSLLKHLTEYNKYLAMWVIYLLDVIEISYSQMMENYIFKPVRNLKVMYQQ